MSFSKKRKPEEHVEDLSEEAFPNYPRKFDRYCSVCGAVMKNLALVKCSGIQCESCTHVYDVGQPAKGKFQKCIVCCAYVKCTEKFCQMCGRHNYFYDPFKPIRMLQDLLLKLRESNRNQFESELTEFKSKLRESIKKEVELELRVEKGVYASSHSIEKVEESSTENCGVGPGTNDKK